MDIVVYLLPLALVLGFVGLLAFMWTLRSGQYDDMEGAAWRAILDDDQDLIPHRKADADKNSHPQDTVDKQ